jgi:3-deoxy-7-phosphoheptulonate synthase
MDPNLDGSCSLDLGLRKARSFLRDLIEIGLPTATELLDPITPQYIADLICWSAVGARTTESQIHRQMASGLSMPMGFKNTTSGNIEAAINAIKAASQPMTFMGINVTGLASEISTNGNPFCHIILRGGDAGPNYSAADIEACLKNLSAGKLPASITIDCSHANSGKEADAQPIVFRDVLATKTSGNSAIKALMLESNLFEGSQSLKGNPLTLRYGVSITDACLGWESTEELLLEAYQKLA